MAKLLLFTPWGELTLHLKPGGGVGAGGNELDAKLGWGMPIPGFTVHCCGGIGPRSFPKRSLFAARFARQATTFLKVAKTIQTDNTVTAPQRL
jgi:hypothetical protein